MKVTMLGTGNALVTECYNTCFVIQDQEKYFLVDGGGGNMLLHQLKKAGIDWKNIRDIFVTHKHVDHILGIIWMVRLICQNMAAGTYQGEANIYGHDEVIGLVESISRELLGAGQTKYIGNRLHLISVEDGEERDIIERKVTFFDIHSTKAKQYGFSMLMNEKDTFTCCGDETYNAYEEKYVTGSKWLLHEAFCLYAQADVFKPYEKQHSTAKDAAEIAQQTGVENLLLYHTEDQTLSTRKQLYTEEAKKYFHGNIVVPEDLEVVDL